MRYRSAKGRHFRLFESFSVEFHPQLNLVVGDNGSGKTSLIEALYLLARGESHRSGIGSVVRDRHSAFALDAEVSMQADAPSDRVALRWEERQLSVEINDQTCTLLDLVRRMPVLLMDPAQHRLVEDSPGVRRRFIDWGVFHVEPQFLVLWRRYQRALRQRNAALRLNAPTPEIESWTPELAAAAAAITDCRARYVARLQGHARREWAELLDLHDGALQFLRGWRDGEPFDDTLRRTIGTDRQLGYTREGPHRAELRIMGDNSPLKEHVSRGQQKLLIMALLLAQAEIHHEVLGRPPALLIDDLPAELSQASQVRLWRRLKRWKGQSIVTSLHPAAIDHADSPHAVFHVEHGHITLKSPA